jgi:uncharacterized protein (DUF302 family)
MEETRYGLRVEIPVPYEQGVEGATAALKAQGFGVLTAIDVKATLKQKLDRTFRKYVILGACNPQTRATQPLHSLDGGPAHSRPRRRSRTRRQCQRTRAG